jgi:hypothetical protein
MYSKEEAKKLRLEFWETFGNYTAFFGKQKIEKVKWLLHKTGIKNIDLKFDVNSKYVMVAIEVNASSEERRFNLFVELNNFKKILNRDLQGELMWQEQFMLKNGKQTSRAYLINEQFNFHNRDHWPEIFRFMAENMYALQNNLMEIKPVFNERV